MKNLNKNILILIAGGTGAGKTTVTNEILEELGESVTVINQDDYYKSYDEIPFEERKKINYDHPEALDMNLLVLHLKRLLKGQSVPMPRYDYIKYKRKSIKEVVRPSKVIILEGIMALEDERIRELASIKIFVESDDDTRFIRRLVRDMNERGRSVDDVIEQYLSTVKPMYHIFAKPTKRYADIIIPNDNSHSIAVDIIIAKIKNILRDLEDE